MSAIARTKWNTRRGDFYLKIKIINFADTTSALQRMKNKTLHVENFGPISQATVNLKTINLFIGEQSIGKSTLAKLITIFTDHISLCKLINGGALIWRDQLKDYGLDIYREDEYHIVYDMEGDGAHFHMEFKPGICLFFLEKDGKKITDVAEVTQEILNRKTIYHQEEVKKQIEDTDEREKIFDILTNSLYIPAERIIYSLFDNLLPALMLTKSTIPQNLLRFMVEYNNAKAEYPEFDVKLLGVKFRHEQAEDSIRIAGEKGASKDIPMPVASSGVQSAVPLILVLHYALHNREFSSFVIEEPECNLFPTKQVELLKDIIGLIKGSSRILTITTHSPYLLSAMNNSLFAGMLVKKFGPGVKRFIDEIIPPAVQLSGDECSVYSLGREINGGKEYCRSLIDEKTGMIDMNSLDEVSEVLAAEFEALQNAVMMSRHA